MGTGNLMFSNNDFFPAIEKNRFLMYTAAQISLKMVKQKVPDTKSVHTVYLFLVHEVLE